MIAVHNQPTTDEFKQLFGISPAIAFIFGQHLAAIERLENYFDWQESNSQLWETIKKGKILVGLGTTHLASHKKYLLQGKVTGDDFLINGTVPRASGQRLFDKLILGFRTDTEIIFAMIDFPKSDNASQKITPHNLAILNPTDSIHIQLTNFKIDKASITSRRPDGSPANVKPLKYWHPEIGIAKRCLSDIDQWLTLTNHPKASNVKEAALRLQKRINVIETIEKDLPSEKDHWETSYEVENIIHTSIRLLTLAMGSVALKKDSEISLLRAQTVLFDVWIQSPDLINAKIQRI